MENFFINKKRLIVEIKKTYISKRKAEFCSASVCRKNRICPRSGHFKSLFCLSFAEAKNTSIRTTVRIVGFADNECGQCGCFGGKVPTGLFRRSQAEFCSASILL